jgi:hypothetical protein
MYSRKRKREREKEIEMRRIGERGAYGTEGAAGAEPEAAPWPDFTTSTSSATTTRGSRTQSIEMRLSVYLHWNTIPPHVLSVISKDLLIHNSNRAELKNAPIAEKESIKKILDFFLSWLAGAADGRKPIFPQ